MEENSLVSNDATNKALISNIYKQSIQLKKKKTRKKKAIEIWAEAPNCHFSKEDFPLSNGQ